MTKQELQEQLKQLNESSVDFKSQREALLSKIKQQDLKEKKEKIDYAIKSSPIDWETVVSIDEENNAYPTAVEHLNSYLDQYKRNVRFNGYFHETKQIAMHLVLDKKMNVDEFFTKISPLITVLKPLKWKDTRKRLIAIPIIDGNSGGEGNYSLLINDKKLACIVNVWGDNVNYKTTFVSIKKALEWARKNIYHYE